MPLLRDPLLAPFPEEPQELLDALPLLALKPADPRLRALRRRPLAPAHLPRRHAGDAARGGVDALEGVLQLQALPVLQRAVGVDLAEGLVIEVGARVEQVEDQLALEGGEPDIVDVADVGEGGGEDYERHCDSFDECLELCGRVQREMGGKGGG